MLPENYEIQPFDMKNIPLMLEVVVPMWRDTRQRCIPFDTGHVFSLETGYVFGSKRQRGARGIQQGGG